MVLRDFKLRGMRQPVVAIGDGARGFWAAVRDMWPKTREQAREAITRFATEYGPKYPKAVTTLEKDADVLLTFFDFPAEHWKHLRTSDESQRWTPVALVA